MRTGLRVVTALFSLFFFVAASAQQDTTRKNVGLIQVEKNFDLIYHGANVTWYNDALNGHYVKKADFIYNHCELVVWCSMNGDTIGRPVIKKMNVVSPDPDEYSVPLKMKKRLATLFHDTTNVSWALNYDVYHFRAEFQLTRNRGYGDFLTVQFHDTLVKSMEVSRPDSSLIPRKISAYLKCNYPKCTVSSLEQNNDSTVGYVIDVSKINSRKYYELWFSSDEIFVKKQKLHYKIRKTRCEFCFTSETQITMAEGAAKPIEQIKAGDRIMNYNCANKQFEIDRVWSIVSPEHDNLVRIKFSDSTTITSTADHPYMVKNKGYTALKVGDICEKADNGKLKELQVISIQPQKGEIKTYNIFTTHNHNYLANGVLVSDEDMENP